MITIRMWTLQEGLMICNEKKTHQDAIQWTNQREEAHRPGHRWSAWGLRSIRREEAGPQQQGTITTPSGRSARPLLLASASSSACWHNSQMWPWPAGDQRSNGWEERLLGGCRCEVEIIQEGAMNGDRLGREAVEEWWRSVERENSRNPIVSWASSTAFTALTKSKHEKVNRKTGD
jgi:hypothetical protein